ncbi:MAG: hypothetical protein ACTHOC_00070 [Luteimonas sp.]
MRPSPSILVPLVLSLASSQAVAASAPKQPPPPEYAGYIAAVRKADAIQDPLQRCLAYPDLPGNTWPEGLAKARCVAFRTRTKYTIDQVETMLAQPDGAKTLEAHFRDLRDAAVADPTRESALSAAFSVFEYGDKDRIERVARAWRDASPDSAFARTALGLVLEQRGWNARGTKYVKDTPDAKLREMERYFADAATELSAALQTDGKLMPACVGLMEIGRQSSDDLQSGATAACLQAEPASYAAIEELMTAAEPRWGGSDEQMRSVAAYALARVDRNPLLALFAFDNAYYAIDHMDDGDDQAIAVLAPAAQQVPNAAYLRLVGGAYLRKGDYWKAFAYLSQALRFMPDYAQESRYRALVLDVLGEPAWARADAERAVALLPDSGLAHQELGEIVRQLEGPAAALPHFELAMKDSATRESVFPEYCGSLIDAGRMEDAGRCVDEELAGYPENPEAWRQRLVVIGYDAPGSLEAMQRFLALNDPSSWSYHAKAADTVRKILAARDGTASADEVFEARTARGRAMEYSLVGRPYFERIRNGTKGFTEGAFGSCRAAIPKPHASLGLAAVFDVMPDGRIANVVVRPENAWSKCFAKQVETVLKLPPPPEGFPSGYPMTFELKAR